MCYIKIQGNQCWLPDIEYKDVEPWLKQFDCGHSCVVPYDTWYLAYSCDEAALSLYFQTTIQVFQKMGYLSNMMQFPTTSVDKHIFLFCYLNPLAFELIDKFGRAFCNTRFLLCNVRFNSLEQFKRR